MMITGSGSGQRAEKSRTRLLKARPTLRVHYGGPMIERFMACGRSAGSSREPPHMVKFAFDFDEKVTAGSFHKWGFLG